MRKSNISNYYTENKVAEDYTEKVIEDCKKRGLERVGMADRIQAFHNFNIHYSKAMKFNRGQIIQGKNEISLELNLYNAMHSKANRN